MRSPRRSGPGRALAPRVLHLVIPRGRRGPERGKDQPGFLGGCQAQSRACPRGCLVFAEHAGRSGLGEPVRWATRMDSSPEVLGAWRGLGDTRLAGPVGMDPARSPDRRGFGQAITSLAVERKQPTLPIPWGCQLERNALLVHRYPGTQAPQDLSHSKAFAHAVPSARNTLPSSRLLGWHSGCC